MSFNKNLETERLILKPTTEEDGAFYHELMNSPKWIQNIGDRNIQSIDQAKNYIREKIIAQQQRLGFSSYTIIRKVDGLKIGTCGLYDRDGVEGVDIGFALVPISEGNGFGFEAAYELLHTAFNEFGLLAISAITSKHNIASQKLLEKLNFKFVGTKILPGDEEELFYYEVKNTSALDQGGNLKE